MLCYAVNLEDDDGTVLVTAPDFPELTTFGDDRDEALMRAVDAMDEAVAARIHDRRDIPMPPPPTPSQVCVQLPTLTAVKVILYQGMRDQNIGKAELARRLGWHLPQVDRVLNVNHHSRLDQMDAALNAIGLRLDVTSVASPASPESEHLGGAGLEAGGGESLLAGEATRRKPRRRPRSGKDMRKDAERVDELRDEYDFSQGVRGKYAARYSEGTNLVVEKSGIGRTGDGTLAIS